LTWAGGVSALTTGSDGALWFTTTQGIGRVTMSGGFTQIEVPFRADCYCRADDVANGPDGAIWFTYNERMGMPTRQIRRSDQKLSIGRVDVLRTRVASSSRGLVRVRCAGERAGGCGFRSTAIVPASPDSTWRISGAPGIDVVKVRARKRS
jgi:ligand-binding sensor domain-containing protein